MREESVSEKNGVKYVLLVDPQLVFLPPLHIKLVVATHFKKALDKNGRGIQVMNQKCSKLIAAELKNLRQLLHHSCSEL